MIPPRITWLIMGLISYSLGLLTLWLWMKDKMDSVSRFVSCFYCAGLTECDNEDVAISRERGYCDGFKRRNAK